MRSLIVSFLLLLILFGCTSGPNYQRPTIETPRSWRFEEKEVRKVANTVWWDQFDDPVLNNLIQTALKQNRDLKIAAARVEEFAGRYGTTRAALFPQVGAGGSAGRSRVTEKSPTGFPSSGENPANSFETFVNASWEIDLWGKLRRATEAARADLLSTEEGKRAIILTLVTSVASAYINLRDLDKQLEIAKGTAKSREESYRLFKIRFGGGVISELELNQVKSEYEQALSTIPVLEKLIAQQENGLSVLLGWNPKPIMRGKTIDQLTLPSVPAGLPSELLANRPDIRQAEQDLIAANARIGRGQVPVFSVDLPDRSVRFRKYRPVQSFCRSGKDLELGSSPCSPDLHRRRDFRTGEIRRSGSAADLTALRAINPGGVSRGRGCPDRPEEDKGTTCGRG